MAVVEEVGDLEFEQYEQDPFKWLQILKKMPNFNPKNQEQIEIWNFRSKIFPLNRYDFLIFDHDAKVTTLTLASLPNIWV